MSPADMARMADALEGQAMHIVLENTYDLPETYTPGYDPDLDPRPAAHAANLFTVAAGLRAMLERKDG